VENEMKKLAARGALAAATVALARTALAAGDSGTSSVAEMEVNPMVFLYLLGGIAAMGGVIFLLMKVLNRK
jgi:hypothetical protein